MVDAIPIILFLHPYLAVERSQRLNELPTEFTQPDVHAQQSDVNT